MNLNEIQDLIKFVSKSGVTEVEIEQKDFKITIKAEKAKADSPIIVQASAPAVLTQLLPQLPLLQLLQHRRSGCRVKIQNTSLLNPR